VKTLAPEAILIGSSAGAFEALSAILPSLPLNYSLSVIVVVHVPPDRTSLMAELFNRKCNIPVWEAEDKQPVEKGNIYFAPPDYHLRIEADRSFSLSQDDPVLYSRPSIDVLFESAAEVFGTGLIGVVLTGANEDGAAGLRHIVDAGGKAIVQNPESAHASAMPYAALSRCEHAEILSLDAIANYLKKVQSNS
jgi:two-component system, chemotaxis family, protein-glutamate methylesterase/glutaminase